MQKSIKVTLTLCLLFFVLCGCASQPDTVKRAQVNIILGLHSNSKAMNIRCIKDKIKKVLLNYDADINFILLDGDPNIVYELSVSVPSYVDDKKKEQLIDGYYEEIISLTDEFVPTEKDTDVFKALKLSSYLAEDEDYESRLLFIFDTMVSTSGLIDLSSFDFLNTENQEILDFLNNQNSSVDFSTYDLIELYGVGQTCTPQKDLSDAYISKLESLYIDFFANSGYKGDSIIKHSEIFSSDNQKYNYPSVKVIDEHNDNKTFIGKSVYVTSIDCDAYFEPNSAVIRNDINTEDLLKEIKKLDKDSCYIILGTTSSFGEEQSRLDISEARAITIRNLMIYEGGFSPDKLSIYAGSINTTFYINDRVDGCLDEQLAKFNRRVYILEDNDESYRLLNNEV